MDAAEAMNHIARAVEEAMGESVDSQIGAPLRGPWLPLSVRYAAAQAAANVVIAWKNAESQPERIFCAHADRNGESAHWKYEGEPCPDSDHPGRSQEVTDG